MVKPPHDFPARTAPPKGELSFSYILPFGARIPYTLDTRSNRARLLALNCQINAHVADDCHSSPRDLHRVTLCYDILMAAADFHFIYLFSFPFLPTRNCFDFSYQIFQPLEEKFLARGFINAPRSLLAFQMLHSRVTFGISR